MIKVPHLDGGKSTEPLWQYLMEGGFGEKMVNFILDMFWIWLGGWKGFSWAGSSGSPAKVPPLHPTLHIITPLWSHKLSGPPATSSIYSLFPLPSGLFPPLSIWQTPTPHMMAVFLSSHQPLSQSRLAHSLQEKTLVAQFFMFNDSSTLTTYLALADLSVCLIPKTVNS